MKKSLFVLLPFIAITGLILFNAFKRADGAEAANGGLTLSGGFSAAIIADNIGYARHMVATPQGDLYVHLAAPRNGKGIIVLHVNGDKAEEKTSFANYGGTGIAIKNGYLYASSSADIFRYKLNAKDEVIDPAHPEK